MLLVSCPFGSLISRWHEDAAALRRRGAEVQAAVLEGCAEELEHELRERTTEALTIQQAARESGYSAEHLGRLVRDGKIPNAGRPNAPRIRRSDVPVKLGHLPPQDAEGHLTASSKRQVVRSIVGRVKEDAR